MGGILSLLPIQQSVVFKLHFGPSFAQFSTFRSIGKNKENQVTFCLGKPTHVVCEIHLLGFYFCFVERV